MPHIGTTDDVNGGVSCSGSSCCEFMLYVVVVTQDMGMSFDYRGVLYSPGGFKRKQGFQRRGGKFCANQRVVSAGNVFIATVDEKK
jgi:hypothetical protein